MWLRSLASRATHVIENWSLSIMEYWIGWATSLWMYLEVFCLNLVWLEKFHCQWLSPKWKLDIVKPGMSDWPDNDWKITSRRNFKLRFSERSLDIVRSFFFEFIVFNYFCCQWYLSKWKMSILKLGMLHWSDSDRIATSTSHSNVKLNYSGRPGDVRREVVFINNQ